MEKMIEIDLNKFFVVNDQNKLKISEEIITTKLSKWKDLAKLYENPYKAEILFGNEGEVVQMLSQVYNGEFLYDPQTLSDSIDMIFDVIEKANNGNNITAKETYLNFGDFRTRTVYLYSIINHLKIVDIIGNEIIDDYENLKTVATDKDILLMLDNGIRNVKTQIKLERQNAQTLQVPKVKI